MIRDGLVVDEYGTKRWYKDGSLHRADGPAVVFVNDYKEWYYKGVFVGEGDHPNPELWARLTSVEANGGPLLNGCVEYLDGVKRWYKDDQLHREDGPAVEWPDGDTDWWLNGRYLGSGTTGFWKLWGKLTEEQRGNPNLLRHLPR